MTPGMDLPYLLDIMKIKNSTPDEFVRSLPFSCGDTTAGVENEFQAAVLGKKKDLDLALTIEDSNYYKNMIRRAASGDISGKKIAALEKFLNQSRDNVWENSWVIELIWAAAFFHTGRSVVTGAEISFHVNESKI